MSYKWPLQVDSLTFKDRLKIAAFFLNKNNRFTQGELVKQYEARWRDEIGSKYAVMVSSGSSANVLIAQKIKFDLEKSGQWPKKNKVILPSLTWMTSCSPFIHLGFEPVFLDISEEDWGLDPKLLMEYLEKNSGNVACVFPTSLLGMACSPLIKDICNKFKIKLAYDNCEASFTKDEEGFYLSMERTSSTSTYIGHFVSSVEGGLIFCNDEEEYRWYLMARNHGLVRSLIPYRDKLTSYDGLTPEELCWESLYNPEADPQFDFNILGSNLRSTDINAFVGLLDFERRHKYIQDRKELSLAFFTNINLNKFELPKKFFSYGTVHFCLPILPKGEAVEYRRKKISKLLKNEGIETRPIISGALGKQTAFKPYIKGSYPVAEKLHNLGQYVGLHSGVKEKDVINLCKELNNL